MSPTSAACRAALEIYIDAKDNTRPARIDELCAPAAVLTFSLATSNIAFPERTVGAAAIAKTLVSDFGAQYAQCRTYYVCDALRVVDGRIDALPWLVVMREPAAGTLRVGHGTYDWTFAQEPDGLRAAHLHIHIARMDVVADPDGALLATLQRELTYPWLTPRELRERFMSTARDVPSLAFIHAFGEAAQPLRA